jgi:hypothetical protein
VRDTEAAGNSSCRATRSGPRELTGKGLQVRTSDFGALILATRRLSAFEIQGEPA